MVDIEHSKGVPVYVVSYSSTADVKHVIIRTYFMCMYIIYYSQPIVRSGVENPDQVFSCWPKLKKIFFTCGRFHTCVYI